MLHRPGSELLRLTPRNNDALLFDGVPGVARTPQEHDEFADALRSRGVEVLYVRELFEQALEVPASQEEVGPAQGPVPVLIAEIQSVVRDRLQVARRRSRPVSIGP